MCCYPLSGSARSLNDGAKVGRSHTTSKFFYELFADTTLILDFCQTLDFNHSVSFLCLFFGILPIFYYLCSQNEIK
jgi:hypothetical protein